MLIAPLIFTTIAVGIANMGAMKDVGRIGLRALIYFEKGAGRPGGQPLAAFLHAPPAGG